jgi:hypothetical protein
LYGVAVAAKKIGGNEKATKYFSKLLELIKNSKRDRFEFKEAKVFLGVDVP